MTWKHITGLLACLAAVIACGFHHGCAVVLPNVLTLVTFISGGIIGDARSAPGGDTRRLIISRPEPPA